MSKGKILVIDDSPIVRKLAEMALTDEGYEVFTAENGEDGLRHAEEMTPSVILVDFIMPRMSGYQFCQLVRENPALKDTPIILITAKGDDVGRKFSERFAVSDYFIKPFKSEALVDKVNAIVLGKDAEGTRYEPPTQSFDAEPAVSIPFGGFDLDQSAPLPAAPPEEPGAGGVAFPFSFEQEPESPVLEPATAEPFSFDAPPAFDLPVSFDASAFEAPGGESVSLDPVEFVEPVEISHHEPVEEVPTFELPSAFELEGSHGAPVFDTASLEESPVAEEPSFDVPSFAVEPVSEVIPEPEVEPAVTVSPSAIAAAAAASAGVAAAALAAHATVPPASVAPEPVAPAVMNKEVMQYIESSLPIIVQKSVDNILKQSGIVRDPSALLTGDLATFDICDVLRTIRNARITGKLFVFLQSMSAEIFFEAGKAITAAVSALDSEKKGYGATAEIGVMQMKALMVDTVTDIMQAQSGTFSVVKETLPDEMLALPLRVGPIELIEQALVQVQPAMIRDAFDTGAMVVRIMDAAALGMLSLSEADRRMLSIVDGPKGIGDVLAAVGGDPGVAKKSLYGLLKLGVLAELG